MWLAKKFKHWNTVKPQLSELTETISTSDIGNLVKLCVKPAALANLTSLKATEPVLNDKYKHT